MSEEVELVSSEELVEQAERRLFAKEYVGMIFPRMISEVAGNTQAQIENIRLMRNSKKKTDAGLNDELKDFEAKLKKMLSEEVLTEVTEKMVDLLAESLTAQELLQAIYHERITIKISGVAARLDDIFNEALNKR